MIAVWFRPVSRLLRSAAAAHLVLEQATTQSLNHSLTHFTRPHAHPPTHSFTIIVISTATPSLSSTITHGSHVHLLTQDPGSAITAQEPLPHSLTPPPSPQPPLTTPSLPSLPHSLPTITITHPPYEGLQEHSILRVCQEEEGGQGRQGRRV
jgi:hypothetical protein